MKRFTTGAALCALFLSTLGLSEVVKKKTYKYEVPIKKYALGLSRPANYQSVPLDNSFKIQDVVLPAHFDLRDFLVDKVPPVLDQGQCGSCVYFSITANFAYSWMLRAKDFTGDHNFMSAEWLLTNAQGGRCSGSYFMATAPATQKGMPAGKDCPYAYGRRGCSNSVQLYGPMQNARLIDNSQKSIMTALTQKYPVSVTIGADGYLQGYRGGILNDTNNVGTNHEILVLGWDAESGTSDGKNVQFGPDGKNLPGGVGYWIGVNSWATSWGEKGFFRIKMTNSNGSLFANMAEEAGVLETGVQPPTPPAPTPVPVPNPFPWSKILQIFFIVGAALGIASFVIVLVTVLKKKEEK